MDLENKPTFCVTRKRKIDKVKADEFLQASADSDDDEEDLKRVFDWMDPIAVKRTAIALEDRNAKRMRLKEEGITHAEDGRYWEAVKKWEVALSLSGFYQKHFPNRGSVSVNGGDEEKGKNERLALKQHTQIGNDAGFSEDRILDAQLLEMKAQALMELDEVFPAVQAAEAAVLSHPAWHIGWRTLGRAQLGFGDGDALKAGSDAKSLTFALDCSYSMNSEQRMVKARENLLKIFDQHIQDEDQLSLVTFADEIQVEFPLREVGSHRQALRSQASNACQPRGCTAFYDAIVSSVENMAKAPSHHRTWIVALTDGHDNKSHHTVESVLKELQSSKTQPALIIIGVQLSDRLKPVMEKLCTATEGSLFIDASGDSSAIDEAFEEGAEIICE